MQLAKAIPLGVFNQDDDGIGDVHPHLDDGGGNQQLKLPGGEGGHHPVLLLPLHLAVEEAHPVPGKGTLHQLLQIGDGGLQAGGAFPRLVLLHQGADDIPLIPGVQMLFDIV